GGEYIAGAVHPGDKTIRVPNVNSPLVKTWSVYGFSVTPEAGTINYDGSQNLQIRLTIRNTGVRPLTGFQITLLSPFRIATTGLVSYSDAVNTLEPDFSLLQDRFLTATVSLSLTDPDFRGEISLLVKTNQNVSRVARVQVN